MSWAARDIVLRRALPRLDRVLGGPARRTVIAVLAAGLALDSADKATVGAASASLQSALHVDRTGIGLLLAVTSIVGTVGTIPFGTLVDRVRRTRLLSGTVLAWAVAMLASAAAPSFMLLVAGQAALGLVTAVAGPAIASLVGDFFPQAERGRIYGYVLTGELLGAGFGFVVSGMLAAVSWRLSFAVLAVPAVGVFLLLRRLPEPARGGPSRLLPGARRIVSADEVAAGTASPYPADPGPGEPTPAAVPAETAAVDAVRRQVRAQHVPPRPGLVLTSNPARMSLWAAARYVLHVPTNVLLIVASALGYFFFAGVRGFGVEFTRHQYGLGQATASSLTLLIGAGAIAGVLLGGRLADRWLRRGFAGARVAVAGAALLATAAVFVPALLTGNLAGALPFLMVAAGLLGATNPPLDAARLDVIHPRLWGRAEAVRAVLRDGAEAAAPLLFGFLADRVLGGATGLRDTFLIMLAPLTAAGLLTVTWARRSYPRDVATVDASLRAERDAAADVAVTTPVG